MQNARLITIQSHRDLIVWQEAMDLVDLVYDACEDFPRKEDIVLLPNLFAPLSQCRRT